jgi:hypothetical protein
VPHTRGGKGAKIANPPTYSAFVPKRVRKGDRYKRIEDPKVRETLKELARRVSDEPRSRRPPRRPPQAEYTGSRSAQS